MKRTYCFVFVVFLVPVLAELQEYQLAYHPRNIVQLLKSKDHPDVSIVGGQEAVPHAYPYQVGIYVKHASITTFCGGSLVSNNYVLTAAHCADTAVSMNLVFGAHNITANESTQVRQTSTNFIVHPKWDPETYQNDVALVKLPSPVAETNSIKIITITKGNDSFSGKQGLVAGWGKTKNGQKGVTATLRYITSNIMSNTDCKKVNDDYNDVITATLLCLSGTGHIGSCEGDSGGPLAVAGVQVGLVAFGDSDCEAGNPSVFTRLTEFRDWIVANSDVH